MVKRYELIPTNGRKSFGGKAIILSYDDRRVLVSYGLPVASIDNNGNFKKLDQYYSTTTMNHVNAFRESARLTRLTRKEWEAIEVE